MAERTYRVTCTRVDTVEIDADSAAEAKWWAANVLKTMPVVLAGTYYQKRRWGKPRFEVRSTPQPRKRGAKKR